MKVPVKTMVAGRRVYDEAVKAALVIIWEAADRICGKRLRAAIPNLILSNGKTRAFATGSSGSHAGNGSECGHD